MHWEGWQMFQKYPSTMEEGWPLWIACPHILGRRNEVPESPQN